MSEGEVEKVELKEKVVESSDKEETGEIGFSDTSSKEEPLLKKKDENIFHVQDVINYLGFGKLQLFLLLFCGLLSMGEDCELMLLTIIMPYLKSHWKLSNFQEGAIGSTVFLGIVLGSVTLGYVGLFALISSVSVNYYMFIFTRLIVGFAIGGGNVVYNLFLEYLPIRNRGAWLLCLNFFWSFGSVFEGVIGYYVFTNEKLFRNHGWRFFLVFSAVPSLLLVLFLPFVPESLRYLSLKGNREKYIKTVRKLEKRSTKKLPKNAILTLKNKKSRQGSLLELVKSYQLFKIFSILVLIYICGSFSYYGISIVSIDMFEEDNKYLGVMYSSFSEVFFLIFLLFFIIFVGRRALLTISFLFSAFLIIFMMIPITSFTYEVIVVFFVRGLVNNSLTIFWILGPESLPTNLRAVSFGISTSIGKGFTIFTPLLITMTRFVSGYLIPKIVFFMLVLIATVLSFFFPIETKGRELSDVFEEK